MFKINDSVKVKPGVLDPDDEKYDMSGWQGRIISIDEDDLITIAWDSATLRQLPKQFVKDSVRDGYSFEEMSLSSSDVELAQARDHAQDVALVADELSDAYYWANMGEQGERIQAILDIIEQDDAKFDDWFDFLKAKLKLPCKAIYQDDSISVIGSFKEVTITRLVDTDDHYGIIASVKCDGDRLQLPLCELQSIEKNKETELLDDYSVWFANKQD